MPGLYSTKGWAVLRAQQLRLQPLCAFCKQMGVVEPAVIVDHIEPHRGDRDLFFSRSNLQSLCKACHDGAKQSLEKTGHLRGSDLAGQPLDAAHRWHLEMDER